MWDGVISNERIVKSKAFGSLCSLSMMEVMSSEDEDDLFSSDEGGEHNVENIMLSSFAHRASRPKKNCVMWL